MAMHGIETLDEHDRMKQLCTLAQCESLSAGEQLELELHLKSCATLLPKSLRC
jgi:hypothetical protein